MIKIVFSILLLLPILGVKSIAQEKNVEAIVIELNGADDLFKTPSFEAFLRMAEEGDALSQTLVAQAYMSGEGIEQSIEKAIFWYKKASAQEFDLAIISLGVFYSEGLGLEKNDKEALRLFQKAEDQNSPFGLMTMGVLYRDGTLVNQDYELAYDYFIKAAKLKNFDAQHMLGEMYFEGLGRKQDLVQAYKWFYLADDDSNEAKQRFKNIENKLTAEQIKKAKQLAIDWLMVHG